MSPKPVQFTHRIQTTLVVLLGSASMLQSIYAMSADIATAAKDDSFQSSVKALEWRDR